MYDLVIHNARVITVSPRGTMDRGAVAVRAGLIAAVGGPELVGAPARERLNASGMTLAPGLVDCHSHLMEYATAGVHRVGPAGQAMAGVVNLFKSRLAGIVGNGEHHLGHPDLIQPTAVYFDLARRFPGKVRVAAGFCVLGTDPLVVTASVRPGQVLTLDGLDLGLVEEAARHSEFPGENLFVTAACANLPPSWLPVPGSCASARSVSGTSSRSSTLPARRWEDMWRGSGPFGPSLTPEATSCTMPTALPRNSPGGWLKQERPW